VPRFRRAATAATLSLLTLAACGGNASKSAAPTAPAEKGTATTTTTAAPTPLELVLASSDKVADISTMRFAATMVMPQGTLVADGAMDTKRPLMSMTMDMGSLLSPAERKLGTKVGMVMTDQAMYMQMPGLAKETGGKHWVRLDFATLGDENFLGPLMEQLRDADPSKNVAFLAGAQDVTTVGVEDVRGVSTTHYKFTIDMQKALADAPENLRQLLSKAAAQVGSMPPMPGEVWLDGDGLPRRFVYEMSMPVPGGAPMTVKADMEMFDFGQPVSVSLPADNDIVDAGNLFGAEGDESQTS
jgi:hypothetical protein